VGIDLGAIGVEGEDVALLCGATVLEGVGNGAILTPPGFETVGGLLKLGLTTGKGVG